jgi:hypothetical protein
MRTSRFKFLSVLVPGMHPEAGRFRDRYDRVQTPKAIDVETLQAMQDVARVELLDVDVAGFVAAARREPVIPDPVHVWDTERDQFGWRVWATGSLQEPRLIGGRVYVVDGEQQLFDPLTWLPSLSRGENGPFVADKTGGVWHLSSINYAGRWARATHDQFEHHPIAFTYGRARGPVTEDTEMPGGGLFRSKHHDVLRLCIPKSHAYLAKQLGDKYGIKATASTEVAALQAAEQSVWRQLAERKPA